MSTPNLDQEMLLGLLMGQGYEGEGVQAQVPEEMSANMAAAMRAMLEKPSRMRRMGRAWRSGRTTPAAQLGRREDEAWQASRQQGQRDLLELAGQLGQGAETETRRRMRSAEWDAKEELNKLVDASERLRVHGIELEPGTMLTEAQVRQMEERLLLNNEGFLSAYDAERLDEHRQGRAGREELAELRLGEARDKAGEWDADAELRRLQREGKVSAARNDASAQEDLAELLKLAEEGQDISQDPRYAGLVAGGYLKSPSKGRSGGGGSGGGGELMTASRKRLLEMAGLWIPGTGQSIPDKVRIPNDDGTYGEPIDLATMTREQFEKLIMWAIHFEQVLGPSGDPAATSPDDDAEIASMPGSPGAPTE